MGAHQTAERIAARVSDWQVGAPRDATALLVFDVPAA